MTIKIVSDGTPSGTKILDTETGKELSYVTKVSWKVDLKSPFATATLEIIKVPVEVVGNAQVELKPLDVKVKDDQPVVPEA